MTTGAVEEVSCLVCRTPMRAKELHGQPVHGCDRCHAISLTWASLRASPREISRALAAPEYQLSTDRCGCGQLFEVAVIELHPKRPEVTRCTRCSRYYFSAAAAGALFPRRSETAAGTTGPDTGGVDTSDAPVAREDGTWVDWLDIFDILDD